HQLKSTLFPYTTLFRSMDVTVNRAKQTDRKQHCPPLLSLARDFHSNGFLCDRAWVVWQGTHRKPTHLCIPHASEPHDFCHQPVRSEEHTSELQSRGHLV